MQANGYQADQVGIKHIIFVLIVIVIIVVVIVIVFFINNFFFSLQTARNTPGLDILFWIQVWSLYELRILAFQRLSSSIFPSLSLLLSLSRFGQWMNQLRNLAFQRLQQLNLPLFVVVAVGLSSRIGDISIFLHYMMFQTIQTIYFLRGAYIIIRSSYMMIMT